MCSRGGGKLVCVSVSVFPGFRGADDVFTAKKCHQHQYSLQDWWCDGQVTWGSWGHGYFVWCWWWFFFGTDDMFVFSRGCLRFLEAFEWNKWHKIIYFLWNIYFGVEHTGIKGNLKVQTQTEAIDTLVPGRESSCWDMLYLNQGGNPAHDQSTGKHDNLQTGTISFFPHLPCVLINQKDLSQEKIESWPKLKMLLVSGVWNSENQAAKGIVINIL